MKELSSFKSLAYGLFDAVTRLVGRHRSVGEARIEMSDSPRILLTEFYGLGDLVILSGVLDPLRRRWPKAKITLLAPPVAKPLFGHDPRIDSLEIYTFPWHPHLQKNAPHRWKWRELRGLAARLSEERWDLMLGRSDLAMNVLARRIAPRVALGFNHPGGKYFLTHWVSDSQDTFNYEGQIWEAYLRRLDCAPESYVPKILSDDTDAEGRALEANIQAWRQPNRPLVVIHPGASILAKCWPLPRFQAVAASLRNRADVLWLLDHNNLQPGAPDERILPVRCGLKALVRLLSSCDCYLGNDSGGMHLAAALGRPTFAVFGPQRPERFAPPNLAGLFFLPDYPCRPCGDACQFEGVPPCYDGIEASRVTREILTYLDRQ